MSSTLWRYSMRQTTRRPLRALLSLCGIVIGVATVVSVSLTTQTMRRVYENTFDSLIGRAQLEVFANGLMDFDPKIVRRLERLGDIKVAVGVVQKPAAMIGSSGPTPILVLGVVPERDELVRSYTIRQGRLLSESLGALVGADFANAHQLKIGTNVTLLTASGVRSVPIQGILEPEGAARFNGGAILVLPRKQVQHWFRMGEKINAIHLVPQANHTLQDARKAVADALPKGMIVQSPASRGTLAKEASLNLEQILAVLGVVSLVTGGFVILNTFQMSLAERRQQLAVIRALGGTSGQVTRLLLREALVYGLVGTLLGIGAGIGIAQSLLPGTERMVGATVPQLEFSREPFLLAILMGPGMTIVAVFIPARRAARRDILTDLLSRQGKSDQELKIWPRLVGLLMIATCVLLIWAFIFDWLSATQGRELLPVAMMLGLIGAILALPLVLPAMLYVSGIIIQLLFRMEGKLAGRQLQRHYSRTVLTVGVLVIAILITVGPGNEITSSLGNLYDWLNKVASVDFMVQTTQPDLGFSLTPAPIPDALAEEIRAMDGVARVDPVNWFPVKVGGQDALLIATTYSIDLPERLNVSYDSPPETVQRLIEGEAVVGTVLAQRLKLNIGDSIQIDSPIGSHRLRVAGKSNQYHVGGMTVHLHRETAKRIFQFDGAHFFSVNAKPGQVEQVERRLRKTCQERGVMLLSFTEMRKDMDRRISSMIGFLWTMMALVFLVGTLGVVNTLSMNVLDQIREFGILRAIGMKRGQIQKLVLAQALTMGLASLVPGVLLGLGMAYMMNLPAEALTGHRWDFQVHGWLIGCATTATIVISLVASFLPAVYAARLPLLRSIRFE